MNSLKTLINEIHRRSLWQVLGIFLAASWGVIEVVDVLTERVGLPDWTPTMAVVLLLIGLPMVLATAFVQEGIGGSALREGADSESGGGGESTAGVAGAGPSRELSAHRAASGRLFTWRNAVLGGLGAFTLLGASIAVYFVMWTSGIGPVGNLVAQGLLEERDPIVLATFTDATGGDVGDVVTEALRVDLLESPVLSIVPAGRLSRALRLMDRPENEVVTPGLAMEIAQREGFKAIIRGEVSAVGSAYVISAAVVASASGDELKAFRVTARSEDELVDAIDKLSQDIREGAGETLRNIKAGAPLEEATTSSFAALRNLTEAERAEGRGQYDEALRLLNEAVSLDPAFAMAYRKIAVLYNNLGQSPDLAREATIKAWEHRDRLTERERYLTEAYYHFAVTGDVSAEEIAYRNALRVASDDAAALNNLALILGQRGDFEGAVELLNRAVSGPGLSSVAMANLVLFSVASGDLARAVEAQGAYEASFPSHTTILLGRAALADEEDRDAVLVALADTMARGSSAVFPGVGAQIVGYRRAAAGRWREAERFLAEAIRIDAEDGRPYGALSLRLDAILARAQVTGQPEHAADSLVALRRAFDSLDPHVRPWARMVVLQAEAGAVEAAHETYAAWPEELFVNNGAGLDLFTRDYAEARLDLARGDVEAAARSLETIRRRRKCPVCYSRDLAQAYARLGRDSEAVALLERERSTSLDLVRWRLDRLLATRAIAPLYEAVGDTAAALGAYGAFVRAWKDADPALQPQVRHARERITALGG
ncbi:MAG: tetratricopeptide repeat protein [Gemmatimonadota bacterium]